MLWLIYIVTKRIDIKHRFTREQIGQALGYDEPHVAIDKIYSKHKDRLDNLSVATKLVGTDG